MRRQAVRGTMIVLMVAIGVAAVPPPAHAVKEFFAEFDAYYVRRNSRKRNDVALAKAVEKAKCTICHPGDDKHKLTAYGAQIAQIINHFDKANKKKIHAAFKEVAEMRSDRHDKKSPTFGVLIKQGKIPQAAWEAEGAK